MRKLTHVEEITPRKDNRLASDLVRTIQEKDKRIKELEKQIKELEFLLEFAERPEWAKHPG